MTQLPSVLPILLGVLGTLIGLVGIIRSRQAKEQARRIAEGAFRRPGLNLSFFGESQCREMYILAPKIRDQVVRIPIDLTIFNVGPNSARNVELYIRVSDLTPLVRGDIVDLEGNPTGQKLRLASKVQKMSVSSVDVGELRPGQGYRLRLRMQVVDRSYARVDVPVPLKDGLVRMLGSYRAVYFMAVTVLASDEPPLATKLDILVIDSTLEALPDWFDKNKDIFFALEPKSDPGRLRRLLHIPYYGRARWVKIVAPSSDDDPDTTRLYSAIVNRSAFIAPALKIEVRPPKGKPAERN